LEHARGNLGDALDVVSTVAILDGILSDTYSVNGKRWQTSYDAETRVVTSQSDGRRIRS
jgi:hypothetical protein